MKNLNTYKIIFIIAFSFLISCRVKTYINNDASFLNNGTSKIEFDLRKIIENKKSGVFIYPNLGTLITIKKGDFNGKFQIIEENDTVFYSNFRNNKPIGYYINNLFKYKNRNRHFRTIPLKPNLDFGNGTGYFNINHQKEGVWKEESNIGTYKNGKKNGYWEENDLKDITYQIKKTGYYKNDLKDSLWIIIESSELDKTIKTEFYIKDSLVKRSIRTIKN